MIKPKRRDAKNLDAKRQVASDPPKASTALEKIPDRSLALPDPLQRYMADIGRFPLLSEEEEKEIAVRYREYGRPLLAATLPGQAEVY